MFGYLSIIAIITTIILGVCFAVYKYSIKPAILSYKIGKNKAKTEKLTGIFEKELKSIVFNGAKKYAAIILLCCIADISNYSASFDAIFSGEENMITITILAITLGIILDQTPSAMADYIFKDEYIHISKAQKRIITIFMILCTSAIVTLIIMLFNLRFNTMELTYSDDLPVSAMKSMTTLWSFIAFGTSVTSFLYSSINKTVIIPMKIRFLVRKYLPLFEKLKITRSRELDEIKGELELNKNERVIEREHKENKKVINARINLLKEIYRVDKSSIIKEVEKQANTISINRFLKESEKQAL